MTKISINVLIYDLKPLETNSKNMKAASHSNYGLVWLTDICEFIFLSDLVIWRLSESHPVIYSPLF